MKVYNKDNTAAELKRRYLSRVNNAIVLKNMMYGYLLGVYLPLLPVAFVVSFHTKIVLWENVNETLHRHFQTIT